MIFIYFLIGNFKEYLQLKAFHPNAQSYFALSFLFNMKGLIYKPVLIPTFSCLTSMVLISEETSQIKMPIS